MLIGLSNEKRSKRICLKGLQGRRIKERKAAKTKIYKLQGFEKEYAYRLCFYGIKITLRNYTQFLSVWLRKQSAEGH